MITVVVLLPFFIVGGCSLVRVEEKKAKKATASELKIKVFFSDEKVIREMPLEEYIKGVVAAEMPASFEIEALKAQAVAARTYAYGRLKGMYIQEDSNHYGADICTDHNCCQAWVSKEEIMDSWGIFSALNNWNKIEKAVNETKNIIIVYENQVINPVFHSNSSGRTENAEDVWGGSPVPYLRSVPSYGENQNEKYITTVSISKKDFISKLKNQYPDIVINESNILGDIAIIDYTEGGRVNNIKVGNVTMKGTDFRELFELRSANFSLKEGNGDTINITTIGSGHGVGMSQYGANYLAKNGGTYEEILKYYYKGVELSEIPSETNT